MTRIYLDNASTSFPKAPETGEEMKKFIENSVSLYRTMSGQTETLFEKIESLREAISLLFDGPGSDCVSFTANVSEAINSVIAGLLKKGDHVIVSSNEHNAVMRSLSRWGIEYSRLESANDGFNRYFNLKNLIKTNTKAIIINAAGNVSGAVQDLSIPAEIAFSKGLLFIVDAAQSAPFHRTSMKDLNISAICFTGHKGFLGPQGTGGFVLRRDIAETMPPLVAGGTGSESDNEDIPSVLPDRLYGGTPNYPGLVGLAHCVKFVMENESDLFNNEKKATERLYEGIREIDKLKIVGAGIERKRTNVISVTCQTKDISEISYELLSRAGIETRVGLHCSPSSHRVLGTYPTGTLRFSPGPFTTGNEIDTTVRTLREILK